MTHPRKKPAGMIRERIGSSLPSGESELQRVCREAMEKPDSEIQFIERRLKRRQPRSPFADTP